jgi:hypothetical protein
MPTRAGIVLAAILWTAALGVPYPAVASPQLGDARTGDDGEIGRDIDSDARHRDAAVNPVSAPSDGIVWVGIPALGSMEGDDGEVLYCSRTRWVRVAPEEREERVENGRSSYLHLFDGVPELQGHDAHLECPVDPTEAIPPAVLRDAVQHTIRDNLPRPDLSVPPGYALTGMPAFLVTNHQLEYGPVSHTVDLGAVVLQVTVEATGTTQVDWGDGTVATYRSPGTPWPDGQVVHTYSDTGPRDDHGDRHMAGHLPGPRSRRRGHRPGTPPPSHPGGPPHPAGAVGPHPQRRVVVFVDHRRSPAKHPRNSAGLGFAHARKPCRGTPLRPRPPGAVGTRRARGEHTASTLA